MAKEASHPNQAIEQNTVKSKVSRVMALLKTKDTMAMFIVATTIMALVMSPCFGQGGGSTSCAGSTLSTLFLWFYMWLWSLLFYFAVEFGKLPGCTVDKCQHSCAARGITNFTAICFNDLEYSCCCEYDCKQGPPAPIWGGVEPATFSSKNNLQR